MKKNIFLILLLIPILIVKAETIEKKYDLCQEGCTYNNINTIFADILAVDKTKSYDFKIEIKDGETYEIERRYGEMFYLDGTAEVQKSTFTIIGLGDNHPTLHVVDNSYTLRLLKVRGLRIENINIDNDSVDIHNNGYNAFAGLEHYLIMKNCNITAKDIWQYGKNATFENCNITTGSILASEDTTYKNTTINLNNNGLNRGIDFGRSNTKLENSTINTNGNRVSTYSLTLTGSTINGNLEASGKQTYTNSKINGSLSVNNGYVNFNNIEITQGLSISKTYCNNFSNEFDTYKSTIKNSKISNQNGTSIFLSNREPDTLTINNSDLTNSKCSIISDIPVPVPCGGASYGQTIYPTFLAYTDDLNIVVDVYNSKVNCAMTKSTDTTINGINMYFNQSNTWSNPISRGTDIDKNNVVELNNGKIYIDFGNKGVLKLNVDLSKPIIDYFKDIIPEGKVLGEWKIEDPTIVKVVDGKIVPLKVGTTKLIATIDNNNYVLEIEVTSDMLPSPKAEQNPDTGAFTSYILFTILIMAALIFINQKNKRIYKIK